MVIVMERQSVFLSEPALLFGVGDCLPELLDGVDLRSVQRLLRHIPPDRRRIQRILHSSTIDFKGVLRRTHLVVDVRPSRLRSATTRVNEIWGPATLNADTDLAVSLLTDYRSVLRWRISDCWTVRVSLPNCNY